jgi:succinate dehydrogenase flavin-adding protein (antitoxin of CptAB toxin-antitoxin module)
MTGDTMAKMSSVVMDVYELLMDGLDDWEIAEIIANQYSIDEDFAFNLVEEILDEAEKYDGK